MKKIIFLCPKENINELMRYSKKNNTGDAEVIYATYSLAATSKSTGAIMHKLGDQNIYIQHYSFKSGVSKGLAKIIKKNQHQNFYLSVMLPESMGDTPISHYLKGTRLERTKHYCDIMKKPLPGRSVVTVIRPNHQTNTVYLKRKDSNRLGINNRLLFAGFVAIVACIALATLFLAGPTAFILVSATSVAAVSLGLIGLMVGVSAIAYSLAFQLPFLIGKIVQPAAAIAHDLVSAITYPAKRVLRYLESRLWHKPSLTFKKPFVVKNPIAKFFVGTAWITLKMLLLPFRVLPREICNFVGVIGQWLGGNEVKPFSRGAVSAAINCESMEGERKQQKKLRSLSVIQDDEIKTPLLTSDNELPINSSQSESSFGKTFLTEPLLSLYQKISRNAYTPTVLSQTVDPFTLITALPLFAKRAELVDPTDISSACGASIFDLSLGSDLDVNEFVKQEFGQHPAY